MIDDGKVPPVEIPNVDKQVGERDSHFARNRNGNIANYHQKWELKQVEKFDEFKT